MASEKGNLSSFARRNIKWEVSEFMRTGINHHDCVEKQTENMSGVQLGRGQLTDEHRGEVSQEQVGVR